MGGNLAITGYKGSDWKGRPIGKYILQLNPTELDVSTSSLMEGKKDKDAEGNEIQGKPPLYMPRSLSLKFTIDATGVLPKEPDGQSIIGSIKRLEKAAIKQDNDSHRPPFVKVQWGKFEFLGVVGSYGFKYTFFDIDGKPLRAEIALKIDNTQDSDKKRKRSPDITKMPTIKDGDNIVNLCEEYYDDKKYYIKLSEFNGLSSIRNLKYGDQLEIPPIK